MRKLLFYNEDDDDDIQLITLVNHEDSSSEYTKMHYSTLSHKKTREFEWEISEKVNLTDCRINPFQFTASHPDETVERMVMFLSEISAQFYHPWTKEMKCSMKIEVSMFVRGWDSQEVPYFRDFELFLEERNSNRTENIIGTDLDNIDTSLQQFDRHKILSCVQFITQLQSPLKTFFHGTTNVPLPLSNGYLHILVPERRTGWEELLLSELIVHYQHTFI